MANTDNKIWVRIREGAVICCDDFTDVARGSRRWATVHINPLGEGRVIYWHSSQGAAEKKATRVCERFYNNPRHPHESAHCWYGGEVVDEQEAQR